MNTAQRTYLQDILGLNKPEYKTLSMDQLESNLKNCGVNLSKSEVNTLYSSLQINEDATENLDRLDRYTNGHLFNLNPESTNIKEIMHKI